MVIRTSSLGKNPGVVDVLTFCFCQLLPLCLLTFALSIEVLLYWVHIFTTVCLLGLISWSLWNCFFVSCSSPHFKVYLSDRCIAIPAFFLFPFAQNNFFHPLNFSLHVSLGLKWVSCKQHIYGVCFCIHSASLCLLVRTFGPFTFKVIINMQVLLHFS